MAGEFSGKFQQDHQCIDESHTLYYFLMKADIISQECGLTFSVYQMYIPDE